MQTVKNALICGGSGFIGHHMARRLKADGYWVRVVDIKRYEYGDEKEFCDEFIQFDLRSQNNYQILVRHRENYVTEQFDEIYMFACLMGGAGYIFTGENDSDIMHDSALINLNVLNQLSSISFKGKIFYSSSACVYPEFLQNDYNNRGLIESDAIPAQPDSCYGWEKLFSERLFLAYQRNKNLNVRIARFHNIYGPEGTYKGGREKAPAAMCRKAINSDLGLNIEVWGTGHQTRSFLYIDDCIDAVRLLMDSDFSGPVNIGSEEMVTINQLAQMAIDLSGKDINIKNIDGPTGVMGRNSNNELIESKLGWKPKYSLKEGMKTTFEWISSQVKG